jgi:NYN domain
VATTIYKLIDGAFFLKLLGDYSRHLSMDLLSTYKWGNLQSGAHRTIFYDALPSRKPNQTEEDFQAAEQKKLDFLNGLRRLPNMQVRDGLTRLKTKSTKEHMRHVLEQKGVDTWIAVDALRYALTGLADEVHIYTSDSDLYPVFEALQDTRCRGVLFYQEGRTSQELIFSADRSEPITYTNIVNFTAFSSILSVENVGARFSSSRRVGVFEQEGVKVELFQEPLRIGANLFIGGVFRQSVVSMSSYLIVDWMNSVGMNVTYAQIDEMVP